MQTQYAFRIVSHQEPPTDSTGYPDLTQNDQANHGYATTSYGGPVPLRYLGITP